MPVKIGVGKFNAFPVLFACGFPTYVLCAKLKSFAKAFSKEGGSNVYNLRKLQCK